MTTETTTETLERTVGPSGPSGSARRPLDRGQIHAIVADILGPDGLAVKANYLHKPEQAEYAGRIAECLERGDRAQELASILAVSADTGLGKTLGYGVPLLAYAAQGRRVVIATNTLALQQQMIGTDEHPGDLTRVKTWLADRGLYVNIARRMGRQAFVSAAAVDNAISAIKGKNIGIPVEEMASLTLLQQFACDANAGLNSGLIEDALELIGGVLPMGIVAAQVCLDSDSPKMDRACYELHREKVGAANVVVMTQQYMAISAKFRREFFAPRLDVDAGNDDGGAGGSSAPADAPWPCAPFDALVVDEADRLSDAASGIFRNDLSLNRLAGALRDPAIASDAAKTLACVEALIKTLEGVPIAAKTKAVPLVALKEDMHAALKEQSLKCADALRSLIKVRKKRAGPKATMTSDQLEWIERMEDAQELLREAFEDSKHGSVTAINFSPVKSLPSISSMPLHPGEILRRLWSVFRDKKGAIQARSPLRSAIFTSATLIAPGADPVSGFKDVARHIGVNNETSDDPKKQYQCIESDLWAAFQPSEFGQMSFVYCDPSIGSPIVRRPGEPEGDFDDDVLFDPSPEWLAYCTMAIKKAHECGGNTLVLTRSYANTKDLACLARAAGLTVLEHERGMSMKEMKKAYMATDGAIWLTHGGWEGLDLPGRVNNLVITRLPLQPPDPVYEALLTQAWAIAPEIARSLVAAEKMNACKRILAQGIGRGVRTPSDCCRVWITDPRVPVPEWLKSATLRIVASEVKRFKSFHECVPERFRQTMKGNSSVLLKTGERVR